MYKAIYRLAGFLALLSAALGVPRVAHAIGPICRVDAAAAPGGDGSTWPKAFNTLQSPLGNAACTEIWVKKGIYKPGTLATDVFQVDDGRKLYGGFAGTETLLSQRLPWKNITILSGDIEGDDTNTDGNFIAETTKDLRNVNSQRVLHLYHVTSTTVVDGFTITAGSGTWGGAGLLCDAFAGVCSPMLKNLVFSGNYATSGGGAMYIYSGGGGVSRPQLTNVTFTGNEAPYGGAIYSINGGGSVSKATFTNVTFKANTATGDAGAFYNDARQGIGSPILKNVTFEGNSATGEGGAMLNWSSGSASDSGTNSPVLTNVTFHGNTAAYGGAMYNRGMYGTLNPKLTNVILWGDTASGTAPNGPEILNEAIAAPTISYSDVQGGCISIAGAICGTGNRNADPKLLPIGNYGGPTQTMPLQFGSAAIDRGTNTGCPTADQRGIARPQDGDGNGTLICDMGATESRLQTASFISAKLYDGWTLESAENSGVGAAMESLGTSFTLGDDAANRQYRAILSFNTAALPDTSPVTAVTLKILRSGLMGADPFNTLGNILLDIRKGAFGASPALEITDFEAVASKTAAASIPNAPVSGWYSKALPSTSFGYINKTGLTQFRLRFAIDDNNNHVADDLTFYSGDAISANRPILTVRYHVP